MPQNEFDLDQLRLLSARLERISADSVWAHRASGIRGKLLRLLERLEKGQPVRASELKHLINLSYWALEMAAQEKIR